MSGDERGAKISAARRATEEVRAAERAAFKNERHVIDAGDLALEFGVKRDQVNSIARRAPELGFVKRIGAGPPVRFFGAEDATTMRKRFACGREAKRTNWINSRWAKQRARGKTKEELAADFAAFKAAELVKDAKQLGDEFGVSDGTVRSLGRQLGLGRKVPGFANCDVLVYSGEDERAMRDHRDRPRADPPLRGKCLDCDAEIRYARRCKACHVLKQGDRWRQEAATVEVIKEKWDLLDCSEIAAELGLQSWTSIANWARQLDLGTHHGPQRRLLFTSNEVNRLKDAIGSSETATFLADPQRRARRYYRRHRTTRLYGQLAGELAEANGNMPGRPRELNGEQKRQILGLRGKKDANGKAPSIRAIARIVAVKKGRVERFLASCETVP